MTSLSTNSLIKISKLS